MEKNDKQEIELIKHLQALKLEPNDVLVLSCDSKINESAQAHLKTLLECHVPGHKVLILQEGMTLGALRSAA